MADLNLTQIEADALIAMEKHRVDDTEWDYPGVGGISVPLVSADRREQFALDFMRYCSVVEPPLIRRGLFT